MCMKLNKVHIKNACPKMETSNAGKETIGTGDQVWFQNPLEKCANTFTSASIWTPPKPTCNTI